MHFYYIAEKMLECTTVFHSYWLLQPHHILYTPSLMPTVSILWIYLPYRFASLHSCEASSIGLLFTTSSTIFCLLPHSTHEGLIPQCLHSLELCWGNWATLGMRSQGLQSMPPLVALFENMRTLRGNMKCSCQDSMLWRYTAAQEKVMKASGKWNKVERALHFMP